MKNFTLSSLLISLMYIGNIFIIYSQNEVIISKNDTLIIELEGQINGNILWQKSENTSAWEDIQSRNTNFLEYIITEPAYFRSKVGEGTSSPYYSDVLTVHMDEKYIVNAGHGFAEPYDAANPGLSMQENGVLSNWTNRSRKATWYLYQKEGTYDMSLYLSSSEQNNYNFNITVSECSSDLGFQTLTQDFNYSSSGSSEKESLFALTVTIPTTGYYKYELEALSAMSGITIHELWFVTTIAPGETNTYDTHATDYLSSPSVHLYFSTTESTTKQYDWMYQEILVPEGYDPLSTYWMSLGFFRGYMGIQTNSETERRVLFSAWDAVDLDRYPDADKELLVSLVDKAEYTKANSFGNEGTGGQSYVGVGNPNTWKTGTPVKFLMNARRDGSIIYQGDEIKHTIISAWYNAGEEWNYIASWRVPIMPGEKDMFDGFYSFLENYGWRNGNLARKGYYYNAFGRETGSDRWVHFNKVGFSNTDGSEGQRIDFEQGVSSEYPGYFYMLTGGFGKTNKTAAQVPLQTNYPSMEIAQFSKRVDQALKEESRINNLEYKDKSLWSIIDFSSQETSGESNGNGLASLIIDGDENTYWHSQWKAGGSSYPHYLVIDMKSEEEVDGFKFTLSGGSNRYMKNIKIEKSNDGQSWTEILHTDAPDESSYILNLSQQETFRYFKLTIYNGQTNEVHTRINEIDVFRNPDEEEKPVLSGLADKSLWSVIDFSSQEISGEPNGNGLASLVIDGEEDTYWHSQWKAGGSSYPHYLVIDMSKEEIVSAFEFTVGPRSDRYMKNIKIEKSNDGETWSELIHLDTPNESKYKVELAEPSVFRYFKLSIYNGHDDEGSNNVHTRLYEIDLYVVSQEENSKINWSVVDFSSQETSGEPDGNGLASLIIDGNKDTYWHSKWTGGGTSYPHYLVIDMSKVQVVNAFEFTVGPRSDRHMKNIKIEKSNDGETWSELIHLDTPNESKYRIELAEPSAFRYFKLTIYSGQNDEGSNDVHTRLYEIDIY